MQREGGTALNLLGEDPRLIDRYGTHLFGRSLLLARRLVESGVPIVQATMGIVQTWDTHVANFPRLRDSLLPPLDQAVSALIDDLEVRGLLDETLVVMLGEFGRTPRIARLTPSDVPGRDHWPAVFPAVFAGAGVVGGQLIGKSDRLGAHPVSRSYGPPDLAATIYPRSGSIRPPSCATVSAARCGYLGRGDGVALHNGAGVISGWLSPSPAAVCISWRVLP